MRRNHWRAVTVLAAAVSGLAASGPFDERPSAVETAGGPSVGGQGPSGSLRALAESLRCPPELNLIGSALYILDGSPGTAATPEEAVVALRSRLSSAGRTAGTSVRRLLDGARETRLGSVDSSDRAIAAYRVVNVGGTWIVSALAECQAAGS